MVLLGILRLMLIQRKLNATSRIVCQDFLSTMAVAKVRTVLVDLSGTLHVDAEEIPGSIDAVNRLSQSGVNLKFVTNTTKESKRCLLDRLTSIGFNVQPSQIFTSLTAARHLIERMEVRPFLMLDRRALEDFEGLDTTNPNAVVIGLAPEDFNYQTMNKAFRLIMDGAALVAIHKARYYKRTDGLALGPGPFVTALEYATDTKADVVGKPEKSFFLSAVEEFKCQPEECVMIGDDVRDDIGGAMATGMFGILVKTGKYRDGDENKIDPKPTYIADNFSGAVDYILQKL
ncbi:haloacid dehalogenase-like hydrolase domain-containing protein 2 [Mizuhopecten yessoensis]|uniref:Haloacid dehalogenase-like hydrolase domain-containing protein 2 n=1 Tax=Mizuhopecten yessoensis TaxID=6573 RepID=A0A210QGG9_MIZYE|nr:haloacid dehalogenase-like hydrolase domain-containing protein 2 [Mizuhopecten yessoensis]OWF47844.1 Haloacid dehalogenase-like hydrolase domain-containing protein 2 [Mizuhopecten yessoensis]